MRRSHVRVRRWAVPVAALAAVLVGSLPGTAGATASTVIADWEMNEPAGATTMADTGPNQLTGTVGATVQTGVVVSGATGFDWSPVKPNQPPANPGRLVQVDSALLNPGTADYAVVFRYRSTVKFGNIVQKGQAHVAGGYFKVEQPGGHLNCFFTGKGGKASIKSPNLTNDGQWHVVRCERTATGVTLTVDGVVVGQAVHATGMISNSSPLTVGGKLSCDNIAITCDYFSGDIDYLVVQKG
jgi:Laminin G domain